MENHTAKHFALQLGSLASLYLSLSFLLVLLFGLINLAFPDATDSAWQVERSSSMVRFGIAIVVVFYPTYLILTRIVNKNRRAHQDQSYLGLTKWLIYLSLLVGGAALLGDLVAVILAFLEGEITTRFIFKAAAVFLVLGAACSYYLLDARGYWVAHERKSIIFGVSATIVVFMTVAFGFGHIDTPSTVREQKLDETQLDDLRDIERRIENHLTVNGTLPETLAELYPGIDVPDAPEDRPDYHYETTADGFVLCATFAANSDPDNYAPARPNPSLGESDTPYIVNPHDWEHGEGEVCFNRIVRNPVDAER